MNTAIQVLMKKTNLSQELKIYKVLLSQRALGLIKKENIFKQPASHFHLKPILGHTVQVISNVKLHKKEYYS